MTLSDFSIKNPVFAVMLSAAMIVFGYLGYRELGISQFPEIDFPVVSITTYRYAADPEPMDFDVTDVIEDAVSSVEGIDYIQSTSSPGVAVTTVYFRLSRDIDAAMQDVQNAVSAAANRLPTDIDPPIISKVNFNKFPVIWLSVHGSVPLQKLNDIVDTHLKQQIETIPGCGGVFYGGLRPRNMRIWLNADELQARNLDALDVNRALRDEHVEKPAGYLQSKNREINVRVMGEARTPEEFAAIPIVKRGSELIRLGDLATVEDGLADRRNFARFNQRTNVGVGVLRATGANVVEVCEEVKRRLPLLRKNLPPGVEVSISTDYSIFIKEDIKEVNRALLEGIILTAIVTFLFLGSLGTTFNVCISIPTSLIGTFLAMKWFGFTINFMTLLALSLSVGIVVDDAILVLENIYRRMENGEDRKTAAVKGAREISFAAIAATLSIAAIFIPVAFMQGAIGRFFFQFGITCTVAVLLSLVISLTITPMLCSFFLSVRHAVLPRPVRYRGLIAWPVNAFNWAAWAFDNYVLTWVFLKPVNWLMDRLTRGYAWVLRFALKHQWYVVPASVGLAASALLFVYGLDVRLPRAVGPYGVQVKPIGRELVPAEDQSRFVVNVICPVGSSIDYIDEMLRKCEVIMGGLEDPKTGKGVIETMFAAVSIRPGQLISEGILFIRLVPINERSWTQHEVIAETRKRLGGIAGMRAVALDLSTQGFTPSRGYPINFAVQGPDWQQVIRLAEEIKQRMIDSGVVTDVNSDYRPGMPEVHVFPDRERLAQVGVPVQRLAWTLNVAFGGIRNGRFTAGDRRYDIGVRLQEQQRQTPDQLDQLYVKTQGGKLVPLADLTTRHAKGTLPQYNRYNHIRKIELTANVAAGASQGEAFGRCLEIADQVREEMGLPESYRPVPMGNAQAMQQTLDSMWAALALGFVVAYMILGVQFNSFVHPLTVLLAVPFGVTGALFVLWICNDTLNLMSMIGLVLLAGLVKKNSIILVDYTNQLRAQGLPLEEAILTACPVRLRPILMTSLACIASAVPLAIGAGAGAETRAPLARSIIGGMFLSTLVTLVIVPVYYILFDRFGAYVARLAHREPRESQHKDDARPDTPAHETNGAAAVPHPEPVPVLALEPRPAT